MKEIMSTVFKMGAIVFIIPLWCMIAWNGFAGEFNLPTFSYWHWVVTALAIRGIFTSAIISHGED